MWGVLGTPVWRGDGSRRRAGIEGLFSCTEDLCHAQITGDFTIKLKSYLPVSSLLLDLWTLLSTDKPPGPVGISQILQGRKAKGRLGWYIVSGAKEEIMSLFRSWEKGTFREGKPGLSCLVWVWTFYSVSAWACLWLLGKAARFMLMPAQDSCAKTCVEAAPHRCADGTKYLSFVIQAWMLWTVKLDDPWAVVTLTQTDRGTVEFTEPLVQGSVYLSQRSVLCGSFGRLN